MKELKCPYCGKPVGYFTAFSLHNQGEFFCNKCKKESNIKIKKTLLFPFIAAVAVALLILLAFLIFTAKDNLWFMLLIAIPFFAFYGITPFFVELTPKKKHMDVLYDTEMVESPIAQPDPTMAKTSRVVPAFVDDVVLDDEYKPKIDASLFESIKKERQSISQTDSDTKAFNGFENISSSKPTEKTMPVADLKKVAEESANKKQEEKKKEENIKEDKELEKINSVIDEILSETDDDVKIAEEKPSDTSSSNSKPEEKKSRIKYNKDEYDLSLFE